ncbi:MAG: hypothetical protein LM558_01515 [Thermosphaera sp.]|nr:hypothetical protein [Thermosphaera sp.]
MEEGLERLYEMLRVERSSVRFLLADPVFHRTICFDMHADKTHLIPLSWFRRRLRGALATFTYKWELAREEERLLRLLLEAGAVRLLPPPVEGARERRVDRWLVMLDPWVKEECLRLLPELLKRALEARNEDYDGED